MSQDYLLLASIYLLGNLLGWMQAMTGERETRPSPTTHNVVRVIDWIILGVFLVLIFGGD